MIAILVAALIGCDGVSRVPCDAALDADVTLVPHITWATPDVGISTVAYTVDGEARQTPAVEGDGTAHDVPLYGIPPLRDVDYTATTVGSTHTWRCEGTVRTGNLPAGFQRIDITVNDPARMSPERYLFGSILGTSSSPEFAIDREGNWVWYADNAYDHFVMMNTIGKHGGVVHNRFSRVPNFRDGELIWAALDGEVSRTAELPGSHHVFSEMDDGTVAYIATDVRNAVVAGVDQAVVGDVVRELALDGSQRDVFNSWDHVDVRDAIADADPYWPEGLDWTHGNALFYVERDDAWLFSMANIRTIVEVGRSSGEVVRSFHGGDEWVTEGGGYAVAEGERFRHQHDVQLNEAGHLVMFATQEASTYGGAFEYAIDDATHTLRETWRYLPLNPGIANYALGQVQELANGDRLVSFSAAGLVREVTPEGEVVWEARAPAFTWFGQVYLVDDLYGTP